VEEAAGKVRTFCAPAVGRRLTIERELKAADEAPTGRLIARFTGAADVLAEASHEVEVVEQALPSSKRTSPRRGSWRGAAGRMRSAPRRWSC